jgi:hypothetical protein
MLPPASIVGGGTMLPAPAGRLGAQHLQADGGKQIALLSPAADNDPSGGSETRVRFLRRFFQGVEKPAAKIKPKQESNHEDNQTI